MSPASGSCPGGCAAFLPKEWSIPITRASRCRTWVRQTAEHPLWAGIEDGTRFYFVHSYFVEPAAAELVAGTSEYPFTFTCAVARDNIFAVQFHPEKSQTAGLRLLANFAGWEPVARR